MVINLDQPDAVKNLQKSPFVIKEGAAYRVRVKFRVQHEIISGLRYLQLVKRGIAQVDKSDQMMVSLPRRREKPRKIKEKSEKKEKKQMLI